MDSRLILITGTTSGLGLETAKKLAKMNFKLVLASRNVKLAEALAEEIRQASGNNNIEVMALNLASFESINEFVEKFEEKYEHLDVLINNAGVFCDRLMKTTEGFEMTMGVNFVGTYYLTKRLIASLSKGDKPRIVNVASKAGFYGKLKISENFFENHPHGFKAYSASKQALLMMTIYLSEQLEKNGISVYAVHPGEVATGIWKGESLLMKLVAPINKRRYTKPNIACETSVYVATSGDLGNHNGELFEKTDQIVPYSQKIMNKESIRNLIEYTQEQIEKHITFLF